MLHVRTVITKSGARAVQVIRYENRKRIVVKHIGSAAQETEVNSLIGKAHLWIAGQTSQLSIFVEPGPATDITQYQFIGTLHQFAYDVLSAIQDHFGYLGEGQKLLSDLVIIRMIEPASKLRSIKLIEDYFNIKHRRQSYYQQAPRWLELKEDVERKAIAVAGKEFGFDYTLLFYDVTTLYFETFVSDDLRKPGFSKDGKSQQPQILVALMVTKEGFPVSYEVFSGNTFEGHTIIPVIKSFIAKHGVKNFTVVADAAMISSTNIEELKLNNIHYIVGARLGNVTDVLLSQIDARLKRQDGNDIRLATKHGNLVCSYSKKRYAKDKVDMDKQIAKAKQILERPSKAKKAKFIKTAQEENKLNEALIQKTEKLLGVKGYYTDLDSKQASNTLVIQRYHDLYKIEQAFRVSKSDLKTRPIFHFKGEPIKLHILVCFMALTISKYIEIKTKASIKSFIYEAMKVKDARMKNLKDQSITTLRSQKSEKLKGFLLKLNLPH